MTDRQKDNLQREKRNLQELFQKIMVNLYQTNGGKFAHNISTFPYFHNGLLMSHEYCVAHVSMNHLETDRFTN